VSCDCACVYVSVCACVCVCVCTCICVCRRFSARGRVRLLVAICWHTSRSHEAQLRAEGWGRGGGLRASWVDLLACCVRMCDAFSFANALANTLEEATEC